MQIPGLSPILQRWPVFAFLASAGMLATAHGFERIGGLPPCLLCLNQREAYWVAGTIALVALAASRLKVTARFQRIFVAVLGIAFLTGAGIALFHAGVELKYWPGPQACSGGGALPSDLANLDLSAALAGPSRIVRCDEVPWSFLGLSMAGWNAVISLALAALSFLAAFASPEARAAARISGESHV